MRLSRRTGPTRKKRHRTFASLTPIGAVCALLSLAVLARAEDATAPNDPIATLRVYVQQVAAAPPKAMAAEDSNSASAGLVRVEPDAFAGLRDFVQGIHDDSAQSTNAPVKLAEADNAFDALREFLRKQNGSEQPAAPNAPAPPPPRPQAPDVPLFEATLVGSKVCLGCHSVLADTFSHTMMGRLQSQGKLQCETCHGPGSAHVRSIGCAACHGDGGITTRPGFPSLVGQSPEYLVAAMKAYVTGQRNHVMMKTLLSGLGDAEINNIAFYYARQAPAQAQTPPVGDPAAGRAATGLCANCHGERGISVSPAFPSLAGQDALYLADALRAYKDGSRNKIIACAGCHGEGGISRKSGIPSLVGLDAQYLVAAMKAYVTGQRKNAVMKALLAGVSDAELNGIAHYYAAQASARAQTPPVGDATAGKAASAACAGCHGEQGVSANPAWPSLAGQDARYFADTLRYYKDGSRSDEIMKGLAASLDEQTINNLASYYASLAPGQPHPIERRCQA